MNVFGSCLLNALRSICLAGAACGVLALPAFAQDKPPAPAASQTTPSAPASAAQSASAPTSSANSANSASAPDSVAFSYDVVSIKPYKQTGEGVSMWMNTSPDGFSSRGFDLKSFMFNAFPIVTEDQLVGLPSWATSEYYTVDAKMSEETAAAYKKLPRDQGRQVWRQMMQDLLADRFQLKFHKETRELPVYNLVIAKGGLKIEPTPEGKSSGYSMGEGKLSGTGIELDSLALSLSGEVGRMIVNKTGLTGRYSMDLKWQPDSMQAGSGAANAEALPDLFTALEEQLGLKLESTKGPVDVYVIDHVERPSEN